MSNSATGNLLGLNEPVPVLPQAEKQNQNLTNIFRVADKYDAGIFLDNDAGHRLSVKDSCMLKITTPFINEAEKGTPFGYSIYSQEYRQFLNNLSQKGQDAAQVFIALHLRNKDTVEHIDSVSGITKDTIVEIKEWVDNNKGKKLVALFDFDRTLSIMEGGFFFGNSLDAVKRFIFNLEYEKKDTNGFSLKYDDGFTRYFYEEDVVSEENPNETTRVEMEVPYRQDLHSRVPKLTIEGFAEYLAGGIDRFLLLQNMFDYLYEHNVDCFILTNNTACVRARGLFEKLGKVFTKGRPIHILCGMEYYGNKGDAVRGRNTNTGPFKALRMMCTTEGGRRRQKTQTQKQKQKHKHKQKGRKQKTIKMRKQ